MQHCSGQGRANSSQTQIQASRQGGTALLIHRTLANRQNPLDHRSHLGQKQSTQQLCFWKSLQYQHRTSPNHAASAAQKRNFKSARHTNSTNQDAPGKIFIQLSALRTFGLLSAFFTAALEMTLTPPSAPPSASIYTPRKYSQLAVNSCAFTSVNLHFPRELTAATAARVAPEACILADGISTALVRG